MPLSETRQMQTAGELVADLGQRLRDYRLLRNLKQETVANKAQVSVRALRNLETGAGSTVDTLVRVLKALGLRENLEHLVPHHIVSPMALLTNRRARARGRR